MFKFMGKCLLVKTGGRNNENSKNSRALASREASRILAIGDLHLGYEGLLNQTGVFVSQQVFEEIISYLDSVFEKAGKVDEIILLGDVKHIFGSIAKQEWVGVSSLFGYLKKKCDKIVVVKGNHDAIIEPIARETGIEVRDFYIVGEYCFLHGHKDFLKKGGENVKFWVMGHGHPAVKISEEGGAKVEKYKCFLVGKYGRKCVVVVPSFFEGNLGSDPRENDLDLAWDFELENFNVWVVSDNLDVLDFGILHEL